MPAQKPKKTTSSPQLKVPANTVSKTAGDIFAKIKTKTGIDKKKVDNWQKKWLAIPEKRTKYEHLVNAPAIVGEELFAMVSDIINFVQKEEGGQSNVFKKAKAGMGIIRRDPMAYMKQCAVTGKKKALQAKDLFEKHVWSKIESKGVQPKQAIKEAPSAPKPSVKKKAAAKPKPAKKARGRK